MASSVKDEDEAQLMPKSSEHFYEQKQPKPATLFFMVNLRAVVQQFPDCQLSFSSTSNGKVRHSTSVWNII